MPILNEKQKLAVEHKTGPLLIIAGAGTGKTTVVTQRIIHLIKSELARPSEILALTFTEKASAEMEERVDIEMPLGYDEVWISTFHSFCDKILRQEGIYIGLNSNYALMTQAQSYILFRKHLFEFPLDKFRPHGNPTKFIADILKHFSRLQDEDISPQEYIDYAKTLAKGKTDIEKEAYAEAKELSETYKTYVDLKIANSKLDFGDLIITTLRLFREKPNILEKYRTKFKYILVDEYQDTNYTQNVLVNMIALGVNPAKATKQQRQKANLTVVGDDDQSIYKFRGAAISNILQFKETYPEVTKIVLKENYRSRQEILDAAYKLIQNNNPYRLEISEGLDKRLISMGKFERAEQEPVKFIKTTDAQSEAEVVVSEIQKLIGENNTTQGQIFDTRGQASFIDIPVEAEQKTEKFKYSDIALLVRANDHADEFVSIFRQYGIPYKFAGPKGLYSRNEVSVLISFLKLLKDYADDLSMFNLIKMDIWSFEPREIVEIMRMAKYKKLSVFEALEELWGIKIGKNAITSDSEPKQLNLLTKMLSQKSISSLASLLLLFEKAFGMIAEGKSVVDIAYMFFSDSGMMGELTKEDSVENLFKIQNINKFLNLINDFEKDSTGTNVFDYVDYLNYSIEIGENPKVDDELMSEYDAINIMTVHSAKGLEFPVVFMVSLVTDRFPSRMRSDTIPVPEALIREELPEGTPTETHLQEERRLFYVGATRAKQILYLTAAEMYAGGKRKRKPSIFIDETLSQPETSQEQPTKDSIEKLAKFAAKISPLEDNIEIAKLNIDLAGKISYSQISTYETCPKQYKYKYILGVPGPKSATISFGRTIHNTLRDFYNLQKDFMMGLEGLMPAPDEAKLLDLYKERWISEGYESRKFEEMRRAHGTKIMQEFFEKFYNATDRPIEIERQFSYRFDGVMISGAIDRIDLIGELSPTNRSVEIIDYKTGSLRDQKEVDDDLQLALYTMVVEELFGMNVEKASLVFVEHGVKVSTITPHEQKIKVKEKVREFITKVKSGDFNPTPSHMCKYCDYRFICEDAAL